jgi:hypothetical protein
MKKMIKFSKLKKKGGGQMRTQTMTTNITGIDAQKWMSFKLLCRRHINPATGKRYNVEDMLKKLIYETVENDEMQTA